MRVLDIEDGGEGDDLAVCLGGRRCSSPGALRRPNGVPVDVEAAKSNGMAISDPLLLEAGIELFAEAFPDQPVETWDLLRTTWTRASEY